MQHVMCMLVKLRRHVVLVALQDTAQIVEPCASICIGGDCGEHGEIVRPGHLVGVHAAHGTCPETVIVADEICGLQSGHIEGLRWRRAGHAD